ncbi:MAG TPA: DUF2207 domain-containing protein [Gammaproteobacteria bacterium]|nr:DUF2207 domain-containing protein [Gammaproteobacteria bacterium]
MRFYTIIIASVLSFAAGPLFAANQQESIPAFDSQVIVNQDTSIDVSETIQILANQHYFQHGLTRQFDFASPKDYEIRSVTVDGVPVSYHVNVKPSQINLDIGEASKLLPPGTYTYNINYHVNNAVHFGAAADELRWNVNSSHWNLPIQKASVTVTLPDAAKILQYDTYINNMQTVNDIRVTQASDGVFSVSTQRALAPHQALSVFISWPKGIVRVKSYPKTLEADLAANRVNEWELGIMLAVLAYYLFFWFRLGRNLHDPHLMPLFQPPATVSAAAANYLLQMRFNDKVLSIGILSLATKHYCAITEKDGAITLIQNKNATAKLNDEEDVLLKALFKDGDTITLTKENRARLQTVKATFRSALKNTYEELYFASNRGIVRLGILLSTLAFIAPVISSIYHFHTLMAVTGLCLFGYALYRLGKTFWRSAVHANHIPKPNYVIIAVIKGVILLVALGLSIYTLNLFTDNIPPTTLVLLGFLLVINVLFYHLMRSPTSAGCDLLNQIEGFKLFFHTTEKPRFAALAPPEMTSDLLDRYIPYAIAMSEENAWGERMIQTTSRSPLSPYVPAWLTLNEKHPAPLRRFPFYMNAMLMHALHQVGA